jgi:hypothetical protein
MRIPFLSQHGTIFLIYARTGTSCNATSGLGNLDTKCTHVPPITTSHQKKSWAHDAAHLLPCSKEAQNILRGGLGMETIRLPIRALLRTILLVATWEEQDVEWQRRRGRRRHRGRSPADRPSLGPGPGRKERHRAVAPPSLHLAAFPVFRGRLGRLALPI